MRNELYARQVWLLPACPPGICNREVEGTLRSERDSEAKDARASSSIGSGNMYLRRIRTTDWGGETKDRIGCGMIWKVSGSPGS